MTETSVTEAVSAAAENAAANGGSAVYAVFTGVLCMALIYLLTVYLPKIAAWADKLLGRDNLPPEPSPERVEDDYKVYDIYEGEMNLDNNDKKE